MTNTEIYEGLQQAMLTAQKTGRITPDSLNEAFAIRGEQLFNMFLKKLEETSEVSDDLAPFIVTLGTPQYPALPLDQFGNAVVPEDYVRRIQAGMKYFVHEGCGTPSSKKYGKVTFMSVDKFYRAMSSTLYKPRKTRLIACQENELFKVAPAGVASNLVFTYVKKPTVTFFDFNVSTTGKCIYLPPGSLHDGTNLPVGTPSRSVDIPFNQSAHFSFYQLLLAHFAIPVEAQTQLQTLSVQK